jgi:MarR family transcriptional regulator, 2-MHQ and catechol-resistance regulon repressor
MASDKSKRVREQPADRLGREAFINLFLASGRLTADVEKICREAGLTMSHYTMLWFLSQKSDGGGVPMGAVIDGHLNRASDATRLADRLTSLGLIERLSSPTDRRVVLIRATDAGRAVFETLTRRIQAVHREQWSGLTSDELRQLRRLLGKVLWGEGASRDKVHPLAGYDSAEEGKP